MVAFNDALFMDAIESTATAVERTASKRWALVHLCGEGDQPGHAATDDAFDDDEYEPAGPSSSRASGFTAKRTEHADLARAYALMMPVASASTHWQWPSAQGDQPGCTSVF